MCVGRARSSGAFFLAFALGSSGASVCARLECAWSVCVRACARPIDDLAHESPGIDTEYAWVLYDACAGLFLRRCLLHLNTGYVTTDVDI